jgi:hypothetical protein
MVFHSIIRIITCAAHHMASTAMPPQWGVVATWPETSSNSERDRRKKIFTPLLEQTLRKPWVVPAADYLAIISGAGTIVDIVEPPQKQLASCLFALALRRTFTGIAVKTVLQTCDALLQIALDNREKTRFHRRALAMDVIANALTLHPAVVAGSASFGQQKSRFVEALPALLVDLAGRRQWAKRTTFQGKGDQEETFEDVATFRIAVAATVEVLVAAGVIASGDVLLPILEEPGYKARDFATKRAASATVASAANLLRVAKGRRELSLRSLDMIGQRQIVTEKPDKGEQKKAFQTGAPSPLVWLWDARSVLHYVAISTRAVAATGSPQAAGVLKSIASASLVEVNIDTAAAMTTNAASLHVVDEAVVAVAFERLLSALLTSSVPLALAGLAALRIFSHSLSLTFVRGGGPGALPWADQLANWLAPIYSSLQHLHTYHSHNAHVVGNAAATWMETMLLRRCAGCLDESDVAEAVGELQDVAVARGCGAAMLTSILNSLEALLQATSSAPEAGHLLEPFRVPLVGLLADVILNSAATTSGSSTLIRQFYRVVDQHAGRRKAQERATGDDAKCFTLLALNAVASDLDPSDPRLLSVTNDRSIIDRQWANAVGDGTRSAESDDTRLRLHQAVLLAPNETSRVALLCVLHSVS